MMLSIIIPVFNEAGLVCHLLQKVADIDGLEKEVIVIDDGSTDGTRAAIAEFIRARPDAAIRLMVHNRNRGKGAAVRTGIESASGDILIIQDADLEYDPDEIPMLVRPIAAGSEQVVYGSRILMEKALGRSGFCGLITGKHPHSYVLAYLGGVAITKWINLLTGSRLTDEPTCYKCFSRQALNGIIIENDDFAWEPEVTMKILNRGIRIAEIPVSYHPRSREEGKKINWRDGLKALWAAWKYR